MRRLVFPLAFLLLAPLAACGSDSEAGEAASRRASQIREAAKEAGLPDDVAEFLGEAAAVVGHTFQVTYDLGDGEGGTAVLSQDPPRRRVDLRTTVEGREVTRSLIADGDGTTVCERAGGTWVCRAGDDDDADVGGFGTEQIEKAVNDLRAAKGAYDFRLGSRKIAGAEARCLVTELKAGQAESPGLGRKGTMCVSEEGVPLLVETPIASLRALKYRDDVDGDVFEPPAEVTEP